MTDDGQVHMGCHTTAKAASHSVLHPLCWVGLDWAGLVWLSGAHLRIPSTE